MNGLDLFNLSGKVAMISGGGNGIGRAMAIGLAEAGSDIVVFSRRLEKCEEVAHEIERQGVRALAFRCDITNEDDVERVVKQTIKNFNKIDILVNNSGRTWGAAPERMGLEAWRKVIELNINGTFLCTQVVGKEMIKKNRGKIVNISSYSGSRGTDPTYMDAIPYNTSKGALNAFTMDLAVKWAKYNINVNAIAPGWFPTKMTEWTFRHRGEAILARIPMKRYGQLKELKGAVIFLSSSASDYLTGQIIGVDGGLTAW
ncbi:SDR family oxidoreductase [bacterium]|nr:SDR family oxidoreductase [bacterium]